MNPSHPSRRAFITGLVTGLGAVALGAAPPPAGPAGEAPVLVPLGRSGLKTSLLGMGTGYKGYGGAAAIVKAGTAESLIRAAYDRGLRYFDLADTYGTQPYLARALKGMPRESMVLGSKLWVVSETPYGPETPAQTVDRFRRELQTDYIDLIQIHGMTESGWTTRYRRTMEGLAELKAKGIIRAHGASIHSLEAMADAAASPWVDVAHVRINAFGENMDDKDPSKVAAGIQQLHRAGKGVIGMKLIGNGAFRNDPAKIDASLQFVLGLGTVDTLIVGFERPEQIDDYLQRIKRARTLLAGKPKAT